MTEPFPRIEPLHTWTESVGPDVSLGAVRATQADLETIREKVNNLVAAVNTIGELISGYIVPAIIRMIDAPERGTDG